jgi:hypothetical protein
MLTSRWQGVFALPLRFQFFQFIFRVTLTLLAKGLLTAVDQPPIPAIGTSEAPNLIVRPHSAPVRTEIGFIPILLQVDAEYGFM